MGVLYLSIELCFDLIACILGIVLAYCEAIIIRSSIGELLLFVSVPYLCGKISAG